MNQKARLVAWTVTVGASSFLLAFAVSVATGFTEYGVLALLVRAGVSSKFISIAMIGAGTAVEAAIGYVVCSVSVRAIRLWPQSLGVAIGLVSLALRLDPSVADGPIALVIAEVLRDLVFVTACVWACRRWHVSQNPRIAPTVSKAERLLPDS